jgi:hypothetical protein
VNHDRVLQVDGDVTDQARDDRPDPRVVDGVGRKSNILDRIVDNSPVAFRSRWTALFFFMGPVVST